MTNKDMLLRFSFEDAGVRGELVNLDASWQRILSGCDYPDIVRNQLGHAMAAVVMLSATVKFNGSLILQAQGEGPLHTLVAQATHLRTIRGLAHWKGDVEGGGLTDVFGHGRLALTINSEGADPYQGIVALEGGTLAEALESYFSQSEQLSARFWMTADGSRASGLCIQMLPSHHGETEDWDRISVLADAVTEEGIMALESEELLYRLFKEERVRLFDPEPVVFRCGCTHRKTERALVALGRSELEAVLRERDVIDVDCEFCSRHYRFDRVDVAQLLAGDVMVRASGVRH
ncbi:MAG: Hsp33 family molecular chaperone HslO [Pseudomonadota bacterium]